MRSILIATSLLLLAPAAAAVAGGTGGIQFTGIVWSSPEDEPWPATGECARNAYVHLFYVDPETGDRETLEWPAVLGTDGYVYCDTTTTPTPDGLEMSADVFQVSIANGTDENDDTVWLVFFFAGSTGEPPSVPPPAVANADPYQGSTGQLTPLSITIVPSGLPDPPPPITPLGVTLVCPATDPYPYGTPPDPSPWATTGTPGPPPANIGWSGPLLTPLITITRPIYGPLVFAYPGYGKKLPLANPDLVP